MCLLLLRIVINEVTRPRTEAAGSSEASSEAPSSRKTTVNITENRLNAAIAAAKSTQPAATALWGMPVYLAVFPSWARVMPPSST